MSSSRSPSYLGIRGNGSGRAVSRILSSRPEGGGEGHLSERPIPGIEPACADWERAVPRSPIWPCSRGGFPCPVICMTGGGLLPRLFTLTGFRERNPAVYSLWHCLLTRPWGRITRVYPRLNRGYAASRPVGVRTFLPQPKLRATFRPSGTTDTVRVPTPDGQRRFASVLLRHLRGDWTRISRIPDIANPASNPCPPRLFFLEVSPACQATNGNSTIRATDSPPSDRTDNSVPGWKHSRRT